MVSVLERRVRGHMMRLSHLPRIFIFHFSVKQETPGPNYDLIWDLAATELTDHRHEVIVPCGLFGVEHDERNNP